MLKTIIYTFYDGHFVKFNYCEGRLQLCNNIFFETLTLLVVSSIKSYKE